MVSGRTIGIAGAGSIGCFVGGMLVAGGRRIALLARPRVIGEMEANGLRPTSFEGFDQTIDARRFALSDNPSILADAAAVLVTVKSADTSTMKSIAEHRGAAGYVIDGAIRDVAAFAASDFPCFARAVIHRGPYKSGPGEINVPVSIGGTVISPGDIVVGDEDGVVSFPAATAATLLEAVRAQVAREEQTLIAIREGRYQGSYGKS